MDGVMIAIAIFVIIIILLLIGIVIWFFVPVSVTLGEIRLLDTNQCVSSTPLMSEEFPLTLQKCGNTGFSQIFNYNSTDKAFRTLGGSCITVQGGSTNNGTKIGISGCPTSGGTIPQDQQFDINSDRTISFTINGTKKCMANVSSQTLVDTCNPNDPNQQWVIR